VWPVGVVVVSEDAEDVLEVASVDDQKPVEAFGPDGADEALSSRPAGRSSRQRRRPAYSRGKCAAGWSEVVGFREASRPADPDSDVPVVDDPGHVSFDVRARLQAIALDPTRQRDHVRALVELGKIGTPESFGAEQCSYVFFGPTTVCASGMPCCCTACVTAREAASSEPADEHARITAPSSLLKTATAPT